MLDGLENCKANTTYDQNSGGNFRNAHPFPPTTGRPEIAAERVRQNDEHDEQSPFERIAPWINDLHDDDQNQQDDENGRP